VARLDRRLTDDGRFIALARFESEEAARRNTDRPEQDRWWTEIAKLFTGAADRSLAAPPTSRQ
jgi:hypothetical protein